MEVKPWLVVAALTSLIVLVTCTDDKSVEKRDVSDNLEEVILPEVDADKRIFRYGRGSIFRYGKRAPSVFRYGKRDSDDDDDDDDENVSAWKRLFRYGKRDGSDTMKRLFRWGKRSDDDMFAAEKRPVFRWGKRSDYEDDEAKRRVFRFGEKRDQDEDSAAIYRYGRARNDSPHVPFRFGDE